MATAKMPHTRKLGMKEEEFIRRDLLLRQERISVVNFATLNFKSSMAFIQDCEKIAALQYSIGMKNESIATRNELARVVNLKIDSLEESLIKKAEAAVQQEKTENKLYKELTGKKDIMGISPGSKFAVKELLELQKNIENEWEDIGDQCSEIIDYRMASATTMIMAGNYQEAFGRTYDAINKYNKSGIFGAAEELMFRLITNGRNKASSLIEEMKFGEANKLFRIMHENAVNTAEIIGISIKNGFHYLIGLDTEFEICAAILLSNMGKGEDAINYVKLVADKHAKNSDDELDFHKLDFRSSMALISSRDAISSLQHHFGMVNESISTRRESIRIINSMIEQVEDNIFKKAEIVKQHGKEISEGERKISANKKKVLMSSSSEFAKEELEQLQETLNGEFNELNNYCDWAIGYRLASATTMIIIGDYSKAFEMTSEAMNKYNKEEIHGPAESLMLRLIVNSEDVADFLSQNGKMAEAIKLLEISFKNAVDTALEVEKLVKNGSSGLISLGTELEKHAARILDYIGRAEEAHLYIQAVADKHINEGDEKSAIELLNYGMSLASNNSYTRIIPPELKDESRK